MPLIPCLSQVTTLSTPFEEDVDAYSRCGWSALEIWLTKLETYLEAHTVEEAAALLKSAGMVAPCAAGQGGLLQSAGPERQATWEHFSKRLEILEAIGVPVLVVAVDFAIEPGPRELGLACDSLAEASEWAAARGVRLALEFQKTARFCASLDTALALVAQSGARNVGVCLDLFHFYTGPSKFEDLGLLSPGSIAWVQVCDLSGTPRELATDSDRILSGDGDFQIEPILAELLRAGYDGHVSLEVLNPQLWGIAADRVADVALRALSRTLDGAEAAAGGPRT